MKAETLSPGPFVVCVHSGYLSTCGHFPCLHGFMPVHEESTLQLKPVKPSFQVEKAVNKLTLRMPHQLFIGGLFVDAEGAKTYETINPTDGSVSVLPSPPLRSHLLSGLLPTPDLASGKPAA